MEAREILQDIIGGFAPDKFTPLEIPVKDGVSRPAELFLTGFTRFFREKNRSFAPRQESFTHYNDEYFSDGMKLGEIKFSESEKLIVCAFKAGRPLSERSGKKAQYEKGKKILKDFQADAGIFIFYDKDDNFRFSLIYPKAIGNRRQWSNFRRFTYFVSRGFTNKTFLQRIGDGDFSSLERIKDAFSVEKVTKEFYEDIANWYFWAVKESTFPKDAEAGENGRNIAVIRLITRMIFIWFMRERGLVPKKLFEEESISAMLKEISPESSTYYQAILQNLFFAALSTKKDERKFRSEIRGYKGYNPDFGNQNVFRFQELFKNQEELKDYFAEIPFLNGGLFECLDDKPNGIYIDGFTAVKKNQPNVPNILFFSGEKKADLNAAYGTKSETYKVRGLLNILTSFNFTIDENLPDDQDIALDPELLGRVFENLLASFNPETSTTARKATGSYYTPREIVDYMVTESLKAYFKTHLSGIEDLDKKIDRLFSTGSEESPFNKSESKKIVELIESVKIVDPAVGSGAFPMGALNKLVFILNKVDSGNELWKQAQLSAADTIPDPRIKQDTQNRIEEFFKGKNADYGRKLYLIQKCIYGVDIQQIAVEIAKLRFFIALLVDEGIDKTKENWGIEPLPNLDFKIMQGNSLISEFLGIDFDNGREKQDLQGQVGFGFENEDDSLIREFERKKIDYQNESDKNKKAKLKNEAEGLMIKIFEANLQKKYSELKPIEERAQSIPNLKTREEYITAEKEKFSKKHGFDLGNIEKQLREFTGKKKTRPFFPWKLYFAEVFEKGGFDIVIGNPPYVQIQNFSGMQEQKEWERQKFETYVKTGDVYCLFYERGYQLLRNGGVLTFITSNKWMRANYGKVMRKFFAEKTNPVKVVDFENYSVFDATVNTNIIMIAKAKNLNSLQAVSIKEDFKETTDIAEYLKTKGVLLKSLGEDSWLISSNEEYAVKKRIEEAGVPLKDWDISINYGIKTGLNEAFIIDGKKKDELIAKDPKSAEIIKPILLGKDIKRYRVEYEDLWLINSHNGYTDKSGNEIPRINVKKDYPAIWEYFNKINKELDGKAEVRYDQGAHWTNLRNCAYVGEFDKPKIAWGNLALSSQFSFVEAGFFVNAPSPLITPGNKYLLAVLNSKVGDYYIRSLGVTRSGGYFEYKPMFVENLPVPKISAENQLPYEILVDCILFCKSCNNMASESTLLESIIDGLVYDLYFPEEMKQSHCYITGRISEVLKPFKKNDSIAFKAEYIKALEKFFNKDETISHSLVHRHLIKSVQIILGDKK